jgi:uncharacterized protein YjdB
MPIVVPVAVTDSFEQWRQKFNICADAVNDIINNEAIADMLTVVSPQEGDILVYDAVDGVFKNESSDTLIETWIDARNIKATSRSREYYIQMSLNII